MATRISMLAAFILFAIIAACAPAPPQRRTELLKSINYTSPTEQGFPNPNTDQLTVIEKTADGTLSDAPPPPKLANSSLTAFQLINFNENFEVAFFSNLVYNITYDVPGFALPDHYKKRELLNILTTIVAQEELHAIDAANTLKHFGAFVPQPCQYKFPTSSAIDAISLAETFTGIVLGTLQDAQQSLSSNGDSGPVREIGSIIGQEGQQSGWFRTLLGRVPSAKPFLTTSTAAYAFSALQQFIESCPFSLSKIDIPIFPPLSILSGNNGNVAPKDQTLGFSADLAGVAAAKPHYGCSDDCSLFVTFLNGQNLPVSEPVSNVQWQGKKITFESNFPFTKYIMEGLTIAALTTGNNFSSFDGLADATLAAPGTIQVNDFFDGRDELRW